ncbi:MAG: LysM peptidoglycan-binding domain-containing protein [Akkermansia sp.]|nr:LysM peptidoglycan-binding domain-containing protein [Akkermansia sp.]MBR6576469.1 LysM peptidoglycan-binding domain-containing protein [Akkermansia sp.]
MKRSLTVISLGVGMLATLSSCSYFRNNSDTLGYEEAMPMSEVAIGDEELPPWVLEGDTTYQVPAGDRTPEMNRNHYATPEPGESMAVSNGLTGQKQPAVAADDTVVDSHVADDFDPYAMPESPATATAATPAPARPAVAAASKPKATRKTPAKKVKKVSEPALVVYKVRPGDNLYEIAKRSNTTIAQIRKDSGIKGDIIHPGQIIKVRFTPKGYKASKNKQTPVSTTYVVKKGDMLSKVAARNGITLAALLKANKMTMAQANKVRPGTKIIIPGKSTTVSKKNKRRR